MASAHRKTVNGNSGAAGGSNAGPESGIEPGTDSRPQGDTDSRPQGDTAPGTETEDLFLKRETVRAMLSHVIDPEVGLDILTMGLIYDVDVTEPDIIRVEMTLTTKGCPMSAYLTGAAKQTVRQVYPDDDIRIELVWDPPWTPAMINRDGLDLLRR